MNRPLRLAVIDLGTNTFHLLVVEISNGRWEFLHRKRIFVNLAETGIRHISNAALTRAHGALETFCRIMDDDEIGIVRAVGTAALRRANNAGTFLAEVRQRTGITVEVVSGDQEAQWIAKGVLAALPPAAIPLLIMDIGGGSVEFILTQNGASVFSRSYPIGVAVLYEQFHDTEPITPGALNRLDDYLGDVLRDLLDHLGLHPGSILVGASGTFEVIEDIVSGTTAYAPYSVFDRDDFESIYRNMIRQDLTERLADPHIPESRAQYIVVAMHLIAFVLRRLENAQAYISAYAMKEGIVEEVISNLD